jgi:hypothetical protein
MFRKTAQEEWRDWLNADKTSRRAKPRPLADAQAPQIPPAHAKRWAPPEDEDYIEYCGSCRESFHESNMDRCEICRVFKCYRCGLWIDRPDEKRHWNCNYCLARERSPPVCVRCHLTFPPDDIVYCTYCGKKTCPACRILVKGPSPDGLWRCAPPHWCSRECIPFAHDLSWR